MGYFTEEQAKRVTEVLNESSKAHKQRLKDWKKSIEENELKMEKNSHWSDFKEWVRDGFDNMFGSFGLMDAIVWLLCIIPLGGTAIYLVSRSASGPYAVDAQSLLTFANNAIPVVGALMVGGLGFFFGKRFVKSIAAKSAAALVSSTKKDAWTALFARRDALLVEWSKYETDIALMIDYPIMTDYTDPEIRKVVTAMQAIRKAEMMSDQASTEAHDSALQDAVDEFEVAFRAAEKYARRYGQTKLTPKEQQKLSTARTALNLILDEQAPAHEVEAAYRSLRSALKGIIDVPQQAIASIEARVRRELQAL